MNISRTLRVAQVSCKLVVSTLFVVACFVGASSTGYCDDDTYNMAPPVQLPSSVSSDPEVATVFNWQEIPVNQDVPITRAVFDQGGYQLYDTVGETIVVRYKDNNLYVMKFGVSDDGSTYFVNTGTSPILYLPQDGYLENATVDGARWYPFGNSFHPSSPVFLGIAPDWSSYVSIGWYPDMYCYGGYWCGTPGGVFEPSIGLFITFGGNRFKSWGDYGHYVGDHPAPYHLGYSNHNIYHYASRTYWGSRQFRGNSSQGNGGRSSGGGGNLSGRVFGGTTGGAPHSFSAGNQHSEGGQSSAPNGFGGASSSGHTFRGASGGPSNGGGSQHSGGFGGGRSGSNGSSSQSGGGTGSRGGGGGGSSHTGGGDSHGGGSGGGDSRGH